MSFIKNAKKLSVVGVASIVASMGAIIPVSAADWSQASYADNDPNTVKIVASDENSVTFTNSKFNTDICKARITLDKVLKNRADYANIAKMEWTVTYTGVTPELTADKLSGGTYVTNASSVGYGIESDDYDEDAEKAIWNNNTYTIQDSYEVPNDTPLVEDGELVFMDWSFADIGSQGVQVTVSDLKIYDKDGNEIEQLGYKEWVEGTTEDDSTEAVQEAEEEVAEETEVEDVETDNIKETEKEVEKEEPASDDIEIIPDEENAETGNLSIYVAVGLLAISVVAVGVISKKLK